MSQARSVCMVGHAASGKTTLVASLLKKGGVKDPISLDPSQEEKHRGYSIDIGLGACEVKGARLALIDTPGGDEFVEEMHKAVPVSDLSVLVVNGEKGVEVVTERAWELIQTLKRPALVFVNHLDKENVGFEKTVSALRDGLQGKFVPVQVPIVKDKTFVGVVDLLRNQAVLFADKAKKEIPSEVADAVATWRGVLLEEVSSLDDELLMKYLEEQEITQAELALALAKGVAAGAIAPVYCGSASQDKGTDLLLEAILALAPAPTGNPGAALSAVVFNLATDPYLGRLVYARIIQGTMKEGTTCFDTGTGTKVEIRDLFVFEGTKQKKVPQAETGEVVAIGKLEGISLRTTLASEAGATPFPMPEFPKPVFPRAIVPKTQADVEKMSSALKEITSTKATVRVEREPVTKETILWGMGDIHLSMVIERLRNRYNVNLDTQRPRTPYKETIRKKATAQYRHKKQTGGRGQFGDVTLRVEPLKTGEPFKFVNEIKGASIPGQYIPGVEKGVVEALDEGILAKYPVTDVLVAVFDGGFHPVDSSELAFKLAARNAFRLALEQAEPCLLEPVMSVEVRAPEDYTGDIVGDLNGRRGRILGMEPLGRVTILRAEVPLSELSSYALDLKSRTQGRATFQMHFLRYQILPANLQEKAVAAAQAEAQ